MSTRTLSSSYHNLNLAIYHAIKIQLLSIITVIMLIGLFNVSTYVNSMNSVVSKEKDSTHRHTIQLESEKLLSIPTLSFDILANPENRSASSNSSIIIDKHQNNLIDIEKLRSDQINQLDKNANHISDSLEEKIKNQGSENNPIVSIIITTKTIMFKDDLTFFEKLGGVIRHIWDDPSDVVYGFSGEIASSKVKEFSKQVGSNIELIEENLPAIRNSDISTHLTMVRTHVWDELNYMGDPNLAVAVLDTGIDDSHLAFSPGYEDQDWSKKIIGWYDATTDGSVTPDDYIGHGSHVAGIVAANEYNDSYDDGRIVSTWSYSYEEWGKSGSFFYIIWVNRTGMIDINYVWQGERNAKGTYLELYAPNGTETASDTSGNSNMTVSHTVSSENAFGYWKVVLGVSWGLSGGILDIAGVNKYPYPDPLDNHSRFTGVAPDVKLVGVKIFNKTGDGTSVEVIEAFNWIKNNKETYHITIASGSFSFRETVVSVDSAAAALINSGVTVVLSAGNYGQGSNSIFSPGQVDGVITVAASDDYDKITTYSSEGPGEVSNTTKPDIAAPGGESVQGGILQVDSNDADSKTFTWGDKFTNDFTNIQGTSMSCPFVSGSLALLIQAMGGYDFWKEGYGSATNPFKIKQLILMTANEIYSDDRGGKDPVEGYGRLNIYAAIEAIENTYEVGTLANGTLSSELGKRKVWVQNVTLTVGTNYSFEIAVPTGADFDFFLYEPYPNQFGEPVIAAKSTNFEHGTDEKIIYTPKKSGTYYLGVKASFTNIGSGTFNLTSTSKPLEGPILKIDSPTGTIYTKNSITVTLSGNASHYWYYIKHVDSSNITWITSINRTLSDGIYTLHAYGNDTSEYETHRSVTFAIDTTPPTVNIISPVAMTYMTSTITVILSGDATNYWYYIQDIDSAINIWTTNEERTLSDGVYTLHAYGNDSIGNEQHVSVIFIIDTTPPTVTIDSPMAKTYTTSTITVTLSGDPDHYWYYIQRVDSKNRSWIANEERRLLDGIYKLHAYGNDSVGNEQHESVIFTIDTIPPNVYIDSPSATNYTISTITVIFSGDADHYWYYIQSVDSSNITWIANEDRTLADGSFTLHAYGNDTVGNKQHVTATFTIDTTPPTVNIDSPTTTTYATSTITVTLSGDATHYWYYIQGVDDSNSTWTMNVDRILSDGIYTLHTFGNDSVGNVAHTSMIFTIDTTPPTVNIDSPVAITYPNSTVTVKLSGDADNYWYYIQGVDSINFTWAASVDRTLSDNNYTLHAYGNDSVGNEQHIAITLTIDTTPPTVNIDLPIAITYPTNTITVTISGDAIDYWYSIDTIDSSNNTWTTSVDRTLPDGTYTLHAYGNDSVDNEQHVTVIFTIDTTPPAVNIDSPAAITYPISTITVTLSGDAAHYWYYIQGIDSNNKTWKTSTDRTLSDNTYSLHAYGNDTVGNEQHVTVTFTVDTTPPIVSIDSPTMTIYATSTITVTLSGDADHYWYFIQHVDSSNITWTANADRTIIDGSFTLHAYGNDTVGNEQHIIITFTIDTTPPTVNIDSPIAITYTKSTITIMLSGDADNYWYYILGIDGSYMPWTTSIKRTLYDGTYILHAHGNDSVGNEALITVTFTLDTTPPQVIIDSLMATTYTISTIPVTLSGDATDYWYSIDTVDSSNYTWTVTVDRSLPDGTYTLHAFGNDSVGNEQHVSVTFTIDTTPPTVIIDSPMTKTYRTSTTSITLSGDAAHYWYYIQGIDSHNKTWTTSLDRTLNDSIYTLHAFGNDSAGNEQQVTITFIIDTTPPTVNIDLPRAAINMISTITISLTGDAENYWYYIEKVDNLNRTWTENTDRLIRDGTYTLYAYGNDSVGNEQYVTVTFTIDTKFPVISLETFNDESILPSGSKIKFNVTDKHLDTVLYYWDRAQNTSIISPYTVKLPEGEGNHTLYILANDSVGHWTTTVFTFTTDDIKPEIKLLDYQNKSILPSATVITLEPNDSHLETVIFNWDGSQNETCIIYEMVFPEGEGEHILYVYANDTAGNWVSVQFIFIIEDRKETTELSLEPTSIQKESFSEDSDDTRAVLTPEEVTAGIILGSLLVSFSLIPIIGRLSKRRYSSSE